VKQADVATSFRQRLGKHVAEIRDILFFGRRTVLESPGRRPPG
jgi:hypothetical protein